MRDLSQQLIELGPRVSFPDPPDLAGAVLADPRLRQTRPPVRIHRAVAVALVAVLVVVLALPGPRAAIASLLGLGGTQITIVDELPSVALTGVIPGDRVTLGEARSQLGFGLLLPDAEPTELYIERSGPSQILTMAFVGDDGAYGLTITEMSTEVDVALLEKAVLPDGKIEPVDVGGDPGYWIEGTHALLFLDGEGMPREVGARLVGNTLLFVRDGVTVRLESGLGLARTLEIAATIHRR